MAPELPIVTFANRKLLRNWLQENHTQSRGVYVRIYKKSSKIEGVTFEEILDEGLCFGWSENKRLPYDKTSYLQRFTPRASKGTASIRNIRHAKELMKQGLMTKAGLDALGDFC